MRIQKTESREQKWKYLKEATGENTVSGALDVATDYYLKMHGDTIAHPSGRIPELIRQADENGSLTATEIAEILNVDELPLKYQSTWTIGE